jgi:tRNA-specific 2-thiouridylase
VRTRHRQRDQACTVDALAGGGCRVATEKPQRAVTPGQSAVFYDGETCLGGGVIARVRSAADAQSP